MVVLGMNWENFNSHPGNPRGYPKCTSTVGIPRPIAPPPHYPHPDTPWSTTKGYKYCGITAKHGVRMNFLNLTGIPHIALGAELWKLLFYLNRIKQRTEDCHPIVPPYFLSKKDYHSSLIGLL